MTAYARLPWSDKASGMIIVLLLVAQFNSIRKPFIILISIPLGIIINNAIVLIDRIPDRTREWLSAVDAIITTTHQRLQLILLTTTTTIGGMLPLWVSYDPMVETMTVVVIILGLAFATLLTLNLVFVLYSFLYQVSFKDYQYL